MFRNGSKLLLHAEEKCVCTLPWKYVIEEYLFLERFEINLVLP